MAMVSPFSTLRALAIGNSFRVMTCSFVPPKSMIAINVLTFCLCSCHANRLLRPVKVIGAGLLARQRHLAGARQVNDPEILQQAKQLLDFALIARYFDGQALRLHITILARKMSLICITSARVLESTAT